MTRKTLGQLVRLAGQRLREQRYRDAVGLVRDAVWLPPADPVEWIELAKRLVFFNESEALVNMGRAALAKPSWSAAAEADLAAMISMVGDQETALALLERAFLIAGPHTAWLYNRSQMHLYLGRFAEAEADLRACLARDPYQPKAYWALGKLGVLTDEDVATLRRLGAHGRADDHEDAYVGFALFAHADRKGLVDDAWSALMAACRAKRRTLTYDAGRTFAYFKALREMPATDCPPTPEDPGPTPIFIVGMHRSGTTLLERILGGHSQVAAGGELYDFPAQLRWAIDRYFVGPSDSAVLERLDRIDFRELGVRYRKQVAWRAGDKPFLVDKLPSNFINVGYLRHALPQAKVIHIHRAPMDTCFSNLKELFSGACPYSYDLRELADYYLESRTLLRHWQDAMPGFVLDVSYEGLTEDPEREARRILAFCGLDWQATCLDTGANARTFNTASSAQVRDPIHRRGVGSWERYAAHLEPLRERLAAADQRPL